MGTNANITLKAMCLIQKDGRTLVSKGFDNVKNQHFYRVLGGHTNFGETAEECVRREIQEELHCDIENLKFLTVIENVFTYRGEDGHEVVFMYSGDLAKKELYDQELIRIVEEIHEFDAVWVPIKDILTGEIPLFPKFNYKELFEL